jgi:tripeptidyl-peptidase-1
MKLTLIASLLAVAAARSTTVEQLHAVPEGWSEIGAPAADQKLHFRIAVRSVSNSLAQGRGLGTVRDRNC